MKLAEIVSAEDLFNPPVEQQLSKAPKSGNDEQIERYWTFWRGASGKNSYLL